ncbi:hypothetical protein OM076_10815 [Solirubrobacter ginsenosidimutans]|uniref:histidine kinase n=1 Tax=Solirubrobacter ginsenosidimutans TaxID=490573 RepID=A0A9X3S165_9ACTN|nr:ATP-binding protein [Solirubrobacter ginsenosidimutans]MDA0160757.1 hypothetical protein [Solirubrobacter ginsenosidimutans]
MAQSALIRVGAGAVVLAAVVAELAAPAGAPALAVLDALVAVAFALGGALAVRSSRLVGWLALAVAATWVAGTLAGLGDLPAYAAAVAVLSHRAPLALLLLAYPGRRLSPVLAVAALLAPLATGVRGPSAAVACLIAAAMLARTARTAPALRAPVAAAALAAVAIAVTAVLAAAQVGSPTESLIAYDIVLLATALTLLVPLRAGRWQAAAASGLVVELGTLPAGAPITARLSRALHDPGLELRLRLPGGRWTDEGGRAAPDPLPGPSRAITGRVLDDGTEVALIHDPAAMPDRALAESAVAVAATAIDNARRDRDIRARIEELHRLRRGLLEAAYEERRQLEAELRSGPLRDVEDLERLLRELPPDQVLEPLRGELVLAHQELVDIARGLYPQALIARGLAGALADLAARAPVPVTVDLTLTDATLPPPVALTAYYVASEALANITKHAHATRAGLHLSASGDELLLRVADDGIGGADPAETGLSGLRDRVQALDGELHVHSPHDAGTTVEARLPIDTARSMPL